MCCLVASCKEIQVLACLFEVRLRAKVRLDDIIACVCSSWLLIRSTCASRSLSVSSVSSASSASSSSSSVRSADSDDMYADLASPVSSASSRSPLPNHPRKERGPPRDRPPHGKDKHRGECKQEGRPPMRDSIRYLENQRQEPSHGSPSDTQRQKLLNFRCQLR